jgi:predicted ATPase/DNA-binding SARP family transcriptional activator
LSRWSGSTTWEAAVAASGVRIRLLGEVGAVTAGGQPVDVGPDKCKALLAALALSPGTPVPVWRLVELVWGGDAPRTAERTLHSYITRLRKSLGAAVIVRTGAAYRLDLAAEAVDAVRFQRRADAGDIDAALAEWTGYPLTGITAPGLAATVDGLVERWLGVVEANLAARVEADAASAVGPLTELTATHPFREGLWALLMTALYRVGRQSDALAAYRTARRNLVERLGVEPGPRLRELESLVLGQDRRLDAAPSAPRGGNLPSRLGRLFGRDAELALVGDALATYPVVTLVGPGGIGKTRLAMAAAGRVACDDGAWLVDLTEIAAPQDVPRVVAAALGLTEAPGRGLGESIVRGFRSRRALLLLDNCEHVVDGAAQLAQAVADGCPDVRVLATSREGLGLRHGHERLIAVSPLEPAGSGAELFNERASALSRSFDPRADRDTVEQICRRLDGLPLAIELAAARMTSLTPAELLTHLDDQLRLLVGGRGTGAGRHRTMRATIQWSYDLLRGAEQVLFGRLSVFAGPFDRAGADAVAAGTAIDVDDILRALVERSMLMAEPGPFGQRFRLLEPMRQFAAERLAESGDAELAAAGHTRYCLDRVTHLHRLLAGPAEVEGAARLDALWPNLRAAVDRACALGDRRLAHALVRPVVAEVGLRNRHEIGDWAERILEMTPPDDEPMVTFALAAAAQRYKLSRNPSGYERLVARYGQPDHPLARHAHASVSGDWAALAGSAPAALAELRRRGEGDLAELVEVDAGAALVFLGEFPAADALIGPLVDRYRRQGPPTLLNWTLMLLGYSAAFQGKQDRAERLFDQALSVRVPERTHSANRPVEAAALFRRGDRPAAYRVLRSHVEELLDTDNMQGACVAAVEFVIMSAVAGRLADSARILGYLDTSGMLDGTVWAAQVAETREALAAAAEPAPDDADAGDDRQALEFMRRTLRNLTHEATSSA